MAEGARLKRRREIIVYKYVLNCIVNNCAKSYKNNTLFREKYRPLEKMCPKCNITGPVCIFYGT
jgi:hypothetical protein